MTRKTLNWDDIYNYIQVAPKDKCVAIVELINRKYGWEDGIPEKTLDDFTMDEVLEYAKAYMGKDLDNNKVDKYIQTRREENKYFGVKCGELTFEQFKEAVTSRSESGKNILSFLNHNDYTQQPIFREIAKIIYPSDVILRIIYNKSQDKYSDRCLGAWYATYYRGAFTVGIERIVKLKAMEPILNILNNKRVNKLNHLVYRTPNTPYCEDYGTGIMTKSALYDSIFNLINVELHNKYKFRTNELVSISFAYDHKNNSNLTTLERLVNIFGYKKILNLLEDIGFENIDASVITDKSFICNLRIPPVSEKTALNLSLSLQVARAINEFKCFWMEDRFKIYDVYATFVNKLADMIRLLDSRYESYVTDVLIQSGLFGTIDLPRRGYREYLCKRVNEFGMDDIIKKIIKFNRGITAKQGLIAMNNQKAFRISDIKWKYGKTTITIPQTVIYFLLKLGITNKELQKVIKCSSTEIIAAAKDDSIWINSPDNWEKGVLKDLCRVCIKHNISHYRLAQILIIIDSSKLYQIYYNLIQEEPNLLTGLTLKK